MRRSPAPAGTGHRAVDPAAGIDAAGNAIAALFVVPIVGFGFGVIGWPIWLGGLIGLAGAGVLAVMLNRRPGP